MKFLVDNKHREFFSERGWITLGKVWAASETEKLKEQMFCALAERMQVPVSRVRKYPSDMLFLHGRDLWRECDQLRKLVSYKGFAEIMAELCNERALRLAFTQLLFGNPAGEKLLPWVGSCASLDESVSIQGLQGALLIALEESSAQTDKDKEQPPDFTQPIFPQTTSETLFISPTLSWQIKTPACYCLIGYGSAASRYRIESKDPFTHLFKKLGYASGDRLKDKDYPIVCR